MPRPRGNPNWGKPELSQPMLCASGFEQVVKALGLLPEQYRGSAGLREWVRRNKDHKYVPLDLLQAWGFTVKSGD